MSTSLTLSLRRRRACDKCFSIKESCKWTGTRDVCDRCYRLNHFCESKRPRGKVGRRPRSDKNSAFFFQQSSSSSDESTTFSVPRSLSTLNYFSQSEKRLAYVVFEKSSLISSLLLGPSFHLPFKQSVLTRLDADPMLLKDGYLAFHGTVALAQGLNLPGITQEVNFERASAALAIFRAKEIANSRSEFGTYMSLAMVIVAFAEWVSGSKVIAICQQALALSKPIYESQTNLEDHDLSSLSMLMFLETTECFFQGEIPTLRYQTGRGESVDRYLGLSLPLLPHLYDLCELNHTMSHSADPRTPSTMEALCRIEQEVDDWRPSTPPDFAKRFSQTEGMHILAQAHVLSLTILLIIHRLRFPFGINDDMATIWSKGILRELEKTRIVTQQTVPFTSFAFLIAAAEVTEIQSRERIIGALKLVRGQPKALQERIIGPLKFFWHLRDSKEGLCWFNLSPYLSRILDPTPES